MSGEQKDGPKLYVVGLKDCKPCEELEEQLKGEEVKKTLIEKFGTDKVEVLYGDEDSEGGNKARNICYSIDKWGGPMLVVEKQSQNPNEKNRICLLNDDLEEEKCGSYRELPL